MNSLQAIINQIKSYPISNVVSKYIKLQNAGPMKKKGCCPFHKEKTASFYVDDRENYYKCFGCGVGGDVINFIEQIKGFEFIETIEYLCDTLSITFDKKLLHQEKNFSKDFNINSDSSNFTSQNENKLQYNVYQTLSVVADFYHKNLFQKKHKFVLDYLLNIRNLTLKTIKTFQIGYSGEKNETLKFVENQKLNLKQLLEVGLIKKYDNNNDYHEFFKERIMIPIMDNKNRIIAFGGRTLDDKDKTIAKYINSSDSFLFKKGEILFNFYNAKQNIGNYSITNNNISNQQIKHFIIVEGYMDVIMLYQNGFHTGIAPLGTSMTEEHLKFLFNYDKSPIFSFDNDFAGENATIKVIEKTISLLKTELIPKFLTIQNAKDIDEFLLKFDAQNLYHLISNSTLEIQEKILQVYLKKYNIENPNQKSILEKEILDLINTIPEENLKKNYIRFFKNKIYEILNNNFYLKKNKKYTTQNFNNDNNVNHISNLKIENLDQKEKKILSFIFTFTSLELENNDLFIETYLSRFSEQNQKIYENLLHDKCTLEFKKNLLEKYMIDIKEESDLNNIFKNLLTNW